MLELNKWFFVLLLNFLVLLYILNVILFKPLLTLFKGREDTVKDSLDAARDMDRRREVVLSQINRELQDARNMAKEIFGKIYKEGMEKQKEILEMANTQASELIENARTELKTASENTRKKLRSDVDGFSDEIVRKLIGT